jgi:hypothetical protein
VCGSSTRIALKQATGGVCGGGGVWLSTQIYGRDTPHPPSLTSRRSKLPRWHVARPILCTHSSHGHPSVHQTDMKGRAAEPTVFGLAEAGEAFVARATFEGPQAGYLFKRGDRGMGYYLQDAKLAIPGLVAALAHSEHNTRELKRKLAEMEHAGAGTQRACPEDTTARCLRVTPGFGFGERAWNDEPLRNRSNRVQTSLTHKPWMRAGGGDIHGGMAIAETPRGLQQPRPQAADATKRWWYIDRQGQEQGAVQGPVKFSQLQQWYNGNALAAGFEVFDRANSTEGWVTYGDACRRWQLLGERLFPLVSRLQPQLAKKITGRLLERTNTDVLKLLESPEFLSTKVLEVMAVLRHDGVLPTDGGHTQRRLYRA